MVLHNQVLREGVAHNFSFYFNDGPSLNKLGKK
jgi:hypothetical protein